MSRNKSNKKNLYVLLPLLALSLLLSVFAPRRIPGHADFDAVSVPTAQQHYHVGDQKHEAPADHEPVFMAIFKFIVNCNPFRKETGF